MGTSIDELLSHSFLASRIWQIKNTIASEPDKLVLWIGAGHSSYLSNLPTWNQFLEGCADKINDSDAAKLIRSLLKAGRMQLAAEYLHNLLGDSLLNQISESFGNYRLTKDVRISSYCATRIITTNYDSIIEDSLNWYDVYNPYDEVTDLFDPTFQVIKLHGTVTNPRSCVLSISSYAKAYNRDFDWYLTNTFLTRTVLFIGTSLDKSEPFFNYILTLKKYKLEHPEHFAILAVRSNDEAKKRGKELAKYGINIIPFIPTSEFQNFGDILDFLQPKVWDPSRLATRIFMIDQFIENKNYSLANTFIKYLSESVISVDTDRRKFGDLMIRYLRLITNGEQDVVSQRISDMEIGNLISSSIDNFDHKSKSFAQLEKILDSSLMKNHPNRNQFAIIKTRVSKIKMRSQ